MLKARIPINHQGQKRNVNRYLITFIVALSLKILITVYLGYHVIPTTFRLVLFILVEIFMNFFSLNVLLQLSIFCYLVYSRYRILNYFFKFHMKSLKNLENLSKFHDKLTQAVELLNDYFGFTALLFVVSSTLYDIFSAFTYYRYIRSGQAIELIVKNVIWGTGYTVYTLILLKMAIVLKKEGRNAAVIAHERINSTVNDQIMDEMFLISQQIQTNQPSVKYGSHEFGFKLLQACVSIVVSYLVILIQFDSTIDIKLDNMGNNNNK